MVQQQLSAIIGSRPRRARPTLLRMKPQQPEARLSARDFDRICAALRYIEAHWREQPTLERMAAVIGLSPYYFNRLFHQWAGITPKAYVQLITGAVAKAGLRKKQPLLHTALSVGLSGPGRLHDLIIKLEAMSPAQYADGGAGLCIEYGVAASPFGLMLAGRTARGVCHLSFVAASDRVAAARTLHESWPKARLRWNPDAAREMADLLWPLDEPRGRRPATPADRQPLRLLVRGSQFQLKVWQALLALDAGDTPSYGELGQKVQQPGAARAIGGAV